MTDCDGVSIENFCEKDKALAATLLAKIKPKQKRERKPPEPGWVPLKDIFGVTKIPETVAKIVLRGMERMLADGDITDKSRFQYLEYVSVEYLNSVQAEVEIRPAEVEQGAGGDPARSKGGG